METEKIARFTVPTVEQVLTIAGVDAETAAKVVAVLAKEVTPEDASEACAAWVRQCFNRPSWHERALAACDELLGGCGVEALNIDNDPNDHRDGNVRFCPAFSYVNFGDPYVATLMRDHDAEEWMICGWGDACEEYEQENEIGNYAKEEEEEDTDEDEDGEEVATE